MKTAAIYNPYWNTLGGGEKYIATAILSFIKAGYHPTLIWHDPKIISQIYNRFGIKLEKTTVDPDLYKLFQTKSTLSKFKSSSLFDCFLWVSDGSVPFLGSKINLLHFQVPFSKRASLLNRLKVRYFDKVLCNSQFTKNIIDKNYTCCSDILYPPVTLIPPLKKEKIILSIGRFDNILHSKRQDVLIEAFKQMNDSDWKLVLAGGSVNPQNKLESLRKFVDGHNIKLMINPPFEQIKNLYQKAQIYWHAAGYGSNLRKSPEKAEHFGISTVEAMSAGAIPIVYAGGGQLEIVHDEDNGFLWKTPEELISITKKIINHELNTNIVIHNAIKTAEKFSQERFIHEFLHYIR